MALHRHLAKAPDAMPKLRIPEDATSPELAARRVRNDLVLDGSARLNLATFVTTWMEPEAASLMADTFDKNMIDKDEYPQTADLEMRCINILADLWHADSEGHAIGTSTTGSSEAAMLGGMALLWRWRARRRAAGKPTDKPNLVTGINVQVCWEKFCRYWDVEPRLAPMEGDRRHLDGEQAAKLCDENTIGVVAVLGSTFDGSYEPVAEISAALDGLQAERDLDVPLHVDAASGGFVAPFIQPDIEWDFRLPRVQSINASGHKYGLVYPGVGWALWRDADALPEELVFRVNYLGGDMPTFALNFSRPGSQVVAQYYNFLRLGREGYRAVQQASQDVARRLSAGIAELGPFELLTDGSDLPVFAFKLRDEVTNYTVFEVSRGLRERGWQVPAYTLPANLEHVAVLRIVVRNGFDQDMADILLSHLRRSIDDDLSNLPAPPPISRPQGFHH
jgi:glutamate decarboxylase